MKNILLTGASGTLGLSIIEQLSQSNQYNIFAQYFSNNEILLEYKNRYPNITLLKADFESSSNSFLKQINEYDIDIFISNCGIINNPLSFDKISDGEWNRIMRVNIDYPRKIAQNLLPNMIRKNNGKMIFISSIFGKIAAQDFSPYVVSKHALIGLSKQIAKEYAACGIKANTICPGTIDSAMMRFLGKIRIEKSGGNIDDYIADLVSEVPEGRLAKAFDIAKTVEFLCSDNSDFICGTDIVIDGAQLT